MAASVAGARHTLRDADGLAYSDRQTDRQTDGRTDGRTLCGVGGHGSGKKAILAGSWSRRATAAVADTKVVPSAARHRRPSRASPATVAGGIARSRRSSIRASGSLRRHPVHPPPHPPPTYGRVTSAAAAAAAASASANLYTGAASKSPGSRERSWTQKPSPPPRVLRRPSSLANIIIIIIVIIEAVFAQRHNNLHALSYRSRTPPTPRNANRIRRPSRSRLRICRGRLMN